MNTNANEASGSFAGALYAKAMGGDRQPKSSG
jgi:hypothetical protein